MIDARSLNRVFICWVLYVDEHGHAATNVLYIWSSTRELLSRSFTFKVWIVCLSRLFSSICLFKIIFECSWDWNKFSVCMLSAVWLGINFLTCLWSSSKALGERSVPSSFTKLRFGYALSLGFWNLTFRLGLADPILFFYPGWTFILIWIEEIWYHCY